MPINEMKTYTKQELDEHTICSFGYGSVIYGTVTSMSDVDVVVIVDDSLDFSEYVNSIYEIKENNNGIEFDTQYINESHFIEMVKNHNILALESLWLPENTMELSKYKYHKYFTLDKWKLRQSISAVASNAWAKCHKKLTVEKDYDFYRGLKSLFHSLRVIIFGIQIAKYGKIVDYSEANYIWRDLWENDICPSHKWEDYKSKYQPVMNALRSEFVKLCPKPV